MSKKMKFEIGDTVKLISGRHDMYMNIGTITGFDSLNRHSEEVNYHVYFESGIERDCNESELEFY